MQRRGAGPCASSECSVTVTPVAVTVVSVVNGVSSMSDDAIGGDRFCTARLPWAGRVRPRSPALPSPLRHITRALQVHH